MTNETTCTSSLASPSFDSHTHDSRLQALTTRAWSSSLTPSSRPAMRACSHARFGILLVLRARGALAAAACTSLILVAVPRRQASRELLGR
ncbi:hypothetical protein IE81DRAFT_90701 [Ceraceosorus guamensis]|uniref:Uncharacterized protein n=1 Tax=Ceraceosorus guamensis TaxID=1522189 RepID=A0A316W0Q3_9BASI|nr:hypothetical protein IE81DRAFT_90701 [Ceraceosorus guamensis]PWN43426.1 hypothetical protein IE81DRAFT_90701 [Ceraceosorus guamensis]